MQTRTMACLAVIAIALCCATGAYAWDVEYSASGGLFPTAASPSWTLTNYNNPAPAISGGLLRIQDNTYNGYTYFTREGSQIDAGVPVTMESRMRVMADQNSYTAMSIQTKGAWSFLLIRPDRLLAYGLDGSHTFYGDFTTFKTIRYAYDGSGLAYAWVDGQTAFSWSVSASEVYQQGVRFGSYTDQLTSDSYWQYVAYSKQFLPVPEPSSFACLAGSFLALVGCTLRRREA